MRIDDRRQAFKLKFLALILALILAWYSLNPARSYKPEGESSDGKERERLPPLLRENARHVEFPEVIGITAPPISNAVSDEDDWPEFIDG
jgi:hypothetical protein